MLDSTTGNYNTALGAQALLRNTTASENTAVGYNAGTVVTTGGANSLFGGYSGNSLSTGSSNTLVGINAGFYATTGISNHVFGSSAGTDAVFNLTTENNRIIVGNNNATNAYVKVAWTVTSDARDKMNFNSVPHGLDFVSKLEPISFQFKKSREEEIPHGNVRYGFKAQDILALEGDNPIIIDNENPDNLKYQGEALVPVLVNAIKELKAEIDLLKNK
jgi:trimeric autotransporter adhesin